MAEPAQHGEGSQNKGIALGPARRIRDSLRRSGQHDRRTLGWQMRDDLSQAQVDSTYVALA